MESTEGLLKVELEPMNVETGQCYLILHKVRGEPAFDIASKLQIGDEEGWIIPTSGHRAYPFMVWNLDDLTDTSDINLYGNHPKPATFDHLVPDDWPDHYEVDKGQAPTPSFNIMAIISPMMKPFKRRL
jgi:hypothetical protein